MKTRRILLTLTIFASFLAASCSDSSDPRDETNIITRSKVTGKSISSEQKTFFVVRITRGYYRPPLEENLVYQVDQATYDSTKIGDNFPVGLTDASATADK